ncbi:MAG: hypothetical protein AUF65_02385 [Chloroflexi bacterium 13_1_20CM_50_12]|nr:MAG: hypothetical protein AUF65_02385 [Chloroflexi bacterium 13_1_20CM_50_12]
MNAEEAARALGCSSKTVRRHLEKGTITAGRKASGELKISDDQVEKLRLVLELEDTSRHVHPTARIDGYGQTDMSRQVGTDIEQRMASLAQSVANLNAAVDSQTRRITELTKRIAELEARTYPISIEPTNIQPVSQKPVDETTKLSTPQNRNVAHSGVSADLPPGTLHSSEFADQLGIKRTVFDSMMKNGIGGEQLERTKIPIAARPGQNKNWFTPDEQEKALALLRKHGKLPDV